MRLIYILLAQSWLVWLVALIVGLSKAKSSPGTAVAIGLVSFAWVALSGCAMIYAMKRKGL